MLHHFPGTRGTLDPKRYTPTDSRSDRSNEVSTLQELKAHLGELVEESIAKNSGRIVKNIGDGTR